MHDEPSSSPAPSQAAVPAPGGRAPFAPFGLSGEAGTDAFWAAARSPVSVPDGDGGWRTLFLWRGSEAVVDFESWSPPLPLRRLAGTDCWYAEVRMPARLRVTYRVLAGGASHADPLNPAGAGADRSLAATPDAPAQPHWPVVGADDVPPLPRTRLRWTGGRPGGRSTARVHPVGGGGPVVLLLDGDDWLYLHPATTAFESAVAAGDMEPVTLVFLPAKDRGTEYACRPGLWEAVGGELLPLLAESGVPAEPDRLVVAGQSLGGLSALYAALEFPGLVRRIAVQSASVWWAPGAAESADPLGGPLGGALAERLRGGPDLSGLRCAFDVGEHEPRMLPHCELVEELTARAGATVRVSRSAAGHDRAGWRHALLRDVAWALG
ncbi:alpha/beta hydrolase-fold protein [Streptomyces sp. NPDC092952]|uniref:alpha/beta hydrolase-fold protein n=1 Tax=Streptomyces sp. NPDC092952 TaxID=3366018 RepID=UPI00380B495A